LASRGIGRRTTFSPAGIPDTASSPAGFRQNRAKIAYHDSATGLPQAHRKRFIDAQPGYEFPGTGVISRNPSAIVASEFKGPGKAILPKRSRERILDGQEKQS
jgi:hypothetical protein